MSKTDPWPKLRLRLHWRRWSDLMIVGAAALIVVVAAVQGTAVGSRTYRISDLVTAVAPQENRRSYYLTSTTHWGHEARFACADGYHMASVWELQDPSNLRYDLLHGATLADSGQGPPAGLVGWVRTGGSAVGLSSQGEPNCLAWTTNMNIWVGSTVKLSSDWSSSLGLGGVWEVRTFGCESRIRVWCIEEAALFADGFESGDTTMWSSTAG